MCRRAEYFVKLRDAATSDSGFEFDRIEIQAGIKIGRCLIARSVDGTGNDIVYALEYLQRQTRRKFNMSPATGVLEKQTLYDQR